MKKFLVAMLGIAATVGVSAQTVEGLIVTAAGENASYPLSEVKQLTFSDEGLTIVKTDDTSVVYPAQWELRFGDVTQSGVNQIESVEDEMVNIYSTNGVLVGRQNREALNLEQLPAGVYIIKSNGQSLKIQK